MDCHRVLSKLDQLPDPGRVPLASDLAEHLESCAACLHVVRERQQLDEAIRRSLHQVEIPAGLEQRLLSSLPEPVVQIKPPADLRPDGRSLPRFGRRVTLATVLGLLLLVGGGWFLESWYSPLRYANVTRQLAAKFESEKPQVWDSLPAFDQGFQVDPGHNLSHRLELSEVRGLDLNRDRRQDAAVFRFQYRQSTGILVVIPTSRCRDLPALNRPQQLLGEASYHWQSPDGKRTYLCFVHSGSPREIAQLLFSSWT